MLICSYCKANFIFTGITLSAVSYNLKSSGILTQVIVRFRSEGKI
ncbi:hypothetical protein Cst_c17400 [Thermoclostridium stercorarium subsp. stercorarium DSM 8532]|uniref:Uncharacterized protein n=1 Tax=Thermoclostridium stercorarium (strain ATCC 35414 / DSM 8532 / NCIMB 11754) TaxID=1121335 RepID=L7VKR9_THES1|nr:hypothetical protein Cst_c17400 [Thermoclostridium stercorarium subsp. stercorarium DSM 8532]